MSSTRPLILPGLLSASAGLASTAHADDCTGLSGASVQILPDSLVITGTGASETYSIEAEELVLPSHTRATEVTIKRWDSSGASSCVVVSGVFDTIVADLGAGDDKWYGDAVDVAQEVYGGGGIDTLEGGGGDDYLEGDQGADLLFGGPGSDQLVGDVGPDELHGGDGDDHLWGDDPALAADLHGRDTLYGGPGDDQIWGHGGGDLMYGGAGRDELRGSKGADFMAGDCHMETAPDGTSSSDVRVFDTSPELDGASVRGTRRAPGPGPDRPGAP